MRIRFNKTFKRLSIILLSFCLLFSCMGLIACNNADLGLNLVVPQNIQYRAGETVDYYDFFEQKDGISYSAKYTYLNDDGTKTKAKAIEGRAFCAVEGSRYTLTVTATKGRKTQSKSIEFYVYDTKPFLVISKASQLYELNKRVAFRVLLDKSNYLVVSDTSYEAWISQVTYQKSMAPTLKPVENSNPKTITEFDKDLEYATRFTFDQPGEYSFKLIIENEGGTTEGEIKALVLSESDIPEDEIPAYKNAEFGKDDNGNFNNVIKLVGQSDLSEASYAVMPFNYSLNMVLRFEFYGSNVPGFIGFLGDDDPDQEDTYSMTQGAGVVFEFSDSENYPICLHGLRRYADDSRYLKRPTPSKKEEQKSELFTLNDFEASKHYMVEFCFKGVGDPYLEDGAMRYADFGTFWYIYEVDDNNPSDPYTVVAYQASHMEAGVISKTAKWLQEARLVVYGQPQADVTFKYYEDALFGTDLSLEEQPTYDKETKVLTWNAIEGAESYVVTINGAQKRLYGNDNTSVDLSGYITNEPFQNINIDIVPSIGYNDYFPDSLNYYLSISPEGLEHIALNGGELDSDKNTVTLNTVGLPSQQYSSIAAIDNAFIAFKGEYGLNTRIDVYFTGNNMPYICLYADKISSDMTSGGGNGFLAINGFLKDDGVTSGHTNWNTRFVMFGAKKFDLSRAKLDSAGDRFIDCPKNNVSTGTAYANATMANLDANTDYKYSIFSYINSSGYLQFKIQLWSIVDEVETRLFGYEGSGTNSAKKFTEDDITAGNIILYAPFKGIGTTTFKYDLPYKCDNFGAPVDESGDDTTDSDGDIVETATSIVYKGQHDESTKTVTLPTGGIADGNFATISAFDNAYFALKGSYGLNTRVDFYFTGNNMPQVCLFADKINGNMTTDGGNGVLFNNGLCTAEGTDPGSTANGKNWNNRYTVFTNKINTKLGSTARLLNCDQSSGDYKLASTAGLVEGTNYKYSIFTYENSSGYFAIKVQLWTIAADGTETRIFAFEGTGGSKVQITADSISAGNIICYAPVKGTGTATFRYDAPYACDNSGTAV